MSNRLDENSTSQPKQIEPHVMHERKSREQRNNAQQFHRSKHFWIASFFSFAAILGCVGSIVGLFQQSGEFGTNCCGTLIFLVLARLAWRKHKQSSSQLESNRVKSSSYARLSNQDFSQIRVYTIRLPYGVKWQPEHAYSLMIRMLSYGQTVFRILAETKSIRWQVISLREAVSSEDWLLGAIRAVFPESQIDVDQLVRPSVSNCIYRATAVFTLSAQDFVAPILYARDLKGTDPLVSLTNIMGELAAGERVEYVIGVGSANSSFNVLGEKLIARSAGYKIFLHSMRSLAKNTTDTIPDDKYDSKVMDILREKLSDDLFPVFTVLQVDATDKERLAQSLVARLNDCCVSISEFSSRYQKLVPQFREDFSGEIRSDDEELKLSALSLITNWLSDEIKLPYVPTITEEIYEDQVRHFPFNLFGGLFNPTKYRDRHDMGFQCILNASELAALWHLPYEVFDAQTIDWIPGKHVPLPSDMHGKTEGVYLGDNLFGGRRHPVYMLPKDRAGHMIVVGKTGMGKSTMLHNLIRQDIVAGRGVALIDPSPNDKNLVPMILQCSIPDNRKRDVVVLDLSDRDTPPPLNMLSLSASVTKGNAAASIRAVFEQVYGSEFSENRMGRTFRMILHAVLADQNPTVRDITRVSSDFEYRDHLLERMTNPAAHSFWKRFMLMSVNEQNNYFGPILGRIEALYDNELLYPAVCHPEALNLGTLIQQGKIILIALCPPQNVGLAPNDQALLGSILVSQFQLAVMAQRPRQPYYLYVDEAQHFVTTALPTLFNEARGQNLSLTLSNQFLKQLAGNTLHAIMGNVGAILSFQVGPDDARALASDIMKPNFTSYDLTHMEVHHSAISMRYNDKQQEPFNLQGHDAPSLPPDAARREAEIRALSRQQYTPKSRSEILAWLANRYPSEQRTGRNRTDEEQFSDPL